MSIENLGSNDPSKLFSDFKTKGDDDLLAMREKVATPFDKKQPRSWGITDAAALIGRSVPWLRDNDPECPVNDKKKRIYSLDRINAIRDAIGTRYVRPKGSRPIIMAVTNFKGGVGKTTKTVHLAQKAAIEGLNVLVSDMDTQASCTFGLGNIIPDIELAREDTCVDAMLEDPDSYKYIIRKTYFPGVSLAPTNLALQDLEMALPNPDLNNQDRLGSAATRLSQCIDTVKDDFDLILIDCPPNMGPITTNALVAANSLLIPIPPKEYDRASFVMFSDALSQLYGALKRPLDYLRIVITMHDKSKVCNEQERKIRQICGEHVTANNLFMSTEVGKASEIQSTIYDLEKPMDKKETYLRALDIFDSVNEEIIADIKSLWEEQANEQR